MTMRRVIRSVAAAAALAVVLVACAGIPRSGTVEVGDVIVSEDNPEIDILSRGPEKDALQEEILRGFVDAAASPQDRYATAREFLTPSFSREWDPDAGVTIDKEASRSYSVTGENSMVLTLTPAADVDAAGVFDVPDSTASVPLGYEFEQVDGQWRIRKAPPGIVLGEPTFGLVFGSYPLYFYDPSFTYLVPEVRWFPRRTSTPTQIVKELLKGPSTWLKGAVVSAFLDGTKLSSDSVQVVARNAQVDLNGEALQTELINLQRMQLQLSASLSSVSAISDVTISTDQIDQQIPKITVNPPIKDPHVDSRSLVLRDGQFGFLAPTANTVAPIVGLSDAIVAIEPSAVTLGSRQASAAALGQDGVYSVRAGSGAQLVDLRRGLIQPAIDDFGYVWSVPADAPGELFVYAQDGTATHVETHWPDATRIISLDVSRDGTRVVALYQAGDTTRFVAAAVLRGDGEKRNAPQSLGGSVTLATGAGVPSDAAWVDELTVASLTALPSGETQVTTQQLGGLSASIEGTPGGVTIAGGNSVRELRILTRTGELELRRGGGWQERINGVSMLGTQQGS
ncbi:GerMN domain-containing protein [Luethyella okanaganae]|uniref:GerMN domain-containing protein n=1 Tax=Luethyella okanaganae TaxID=69372 RepID=A0ABW1VA44_9MICO